MAKSRVEKNKDLYDEIELGSFEVEDITSETKEVKEPVKKEEKKQEIVPVREKKHPVAKVEKKKKIEIEEEFVVEQPISYTDKLSVEEILRAKLEKQQKLKDSKKMYKKSPITEDYTPEMMQKNIKQSEGVDIRKEANIKVKKGNNLVIALLVLLLIVVIVAGVVAGYMITK